MTKIFQTESVYVRVDVSDYFILSRGTERAQALLGRAQLVEESIKRHVDDVAATSIESDGDYSCSHCELEWEEWEEADEEGSAAGLGFMRGEPMCCDAASEEWREAKAKRDAAGKKASA